MSNTISLLYQMPDHPPYGIFRTLAARLLGLFLCLSPICSWAASSSEGYQTTISVQTQSVQERTKGLQEALVQILGQTTARFDLRAHPAMTAAFEQPEQWLDWFQYEPEEEGLVLRAQFNEARIMALLAEANIPAWGSKRALTVVWLTLKTPSGMQWITDDQTIFSQVQQACETVGLPVVLPVLDLEELGAIETTPAGVAQASQRYRGNAWVLAELKAVDQGWTASWDLGADQARWHIDCTGEHLEALMRNGFTQTAQFFIQHYAQQHQTQSAEPVFITINKVHNISQFKNIFMYLNQLSLSESVTLVTIDKDVIVLELRPRGGVSALLQAVRLEPKMVLVPGGDPQNLVFRWLS